MLARLLRSAGIAALLAASAALVTPSAFAQADQQKIVDKSVASLDDFMRDPQMKWLQNNINRAKGVLIAPEVLKAGFIFGGSGGMATLVARDPKSGKWVGPAFYGLATASVAAGPVGAGASGDVTSDLVAFARSKGVYGGVNLDGTVVNTADDYNAKYYGKKVQSPDILIRQDVHAKGDDKLRAAVAAAAAKK